MNKVVLQEDLKKVDDKIGDMSILDSDLNTQLLADNKNPDCVNILNFLFQCGNNVKADTVTALLAKGATGVTVDSPWTDIISAINNMFVNTGSGTGVIGEIQRITKLNISAGDTKTVNLGRIVEDFKLATSVLLFVPGNIGVVEHICGFDNSDSSNFNYDPTYIVFDGKMQPINSISIPLTKLGTIGNFEVYECEVDESPYKSVDNFVDSDANLTLGVVPPDQLITAKSDIDLTGIDKLKAISESSAGFRFALSFNKGVTYYVWNGSTWITVDIADSNDVNTKFMTNAVLSGLTDVQLEIIRNGSTTLRIAYLNEQTVSSDSSYTDQLDITVNLKGYDEIAPQANWSYMLLDDKQTIQYIFLVAGTYTINYI